jgi:hypothetical protein
MVGPVCLWSSRFLLGVGAYFILIGTSERLPTRTMVDVWSGTIRKSSVVEPRRLPSDHLPQLPEVVL